MNVSKYKKRILEILQNNPVHPNANELYLLVKDKYPEVGIATIYRNLDSLVSSGEIIRFNTDSQYDRYDATVKEHYHMICTECGNVYDIPSEAINIVNKEISELTGHNISEHNLILKGVCYKCKNK